MGKVSTNTKLIIINDIKKKLNDLITICSIFVYDKKFILNKLDVSYLEALIDFISNLDSTIIIRINDAIKFINLFFNSFNTITFIKESINTINSISYDYINYAGSLPNKDTGKWLKNKIDPILEAIMPESIYYVMKKLLTILDPIWMALEYLTYNLYIKNTNYITIIVEKLEEYHNKSNLLQDINDIVF